MDDKLCGVLLGFDCNYLQFSTVNIFSPARSWYADVTDIAVSNLPKVKLTDEKDKNVWN